MGIAEGPLATVAKKLCFSVKFWNDDNKKKEVLKRAEGNRGRGEHGREQKSKPRAPQRVAHEGEVRPGKINWMVRGEATTEGLRWPQGKHLRAENGEAAGRTAPASQGGNMLTGIEKQNWKLVQI